MSYRRVLLLASLDCDSRAAATLIARLAPAAELVVVAARMPPQRIAWFSAAAPAELQKTADESLQALRNATRALAPAVEVNLITEMNADELAAVATSAAIDLIVAHHLPLTDLGTVAEIRKRASLAVLWSQSDSIGRVIEVRCVAVGHRATAAMAAFLREHGDATQHARLIAAIPPPSVDDIDLLVVPRFPGALLPVLAQRAPVLVLPPVAPVRPQLERDIDAADAVVDNGVIRTTIRYATGVGRLDPIPDQPIVVVPRAAALVTVTTQDGAIELEAAGVAGALTLRLPSSELEIEVIRPGSRPLVLFDPAIDNIGILSGADLLAVRLRPIRSCRSIRAQLMKAGLAPRVVDASAVLDEGSALDVAPNVDAVRLARVGARMRAAGFPVAAIIYCAPRMPKTFGFVALRPEELASAKLEIVRPNLGTRSLDQRLDDVTGTRTIAGNRIELEIDNAKARRWLLDGIANAKQRIHLQLYMAAADDVGTQVEAALAAAGARGVKVRVVVDSLHGFEGSFGLHNPLLQRLGSRPGVELRLLHPITTAPTIEDIKQRDHRKLALFDNTIALLGGRNLSHEYYSGFEEVPLTAKSSWREVPWLDAGARVEGPAVAALERSFLDAWTAAGGGALEISEPAQVGATAARVVTHHGLRDACTLDAYVALIDAAQSHVYVVNGFPLVLEVQHALLRALRRGVGVRTLFGNLTPTHGGQPFDGPWSSARTDATALVHSRMDVLVAAGAEAYELAIPPQKTWAADVGEIHPHVHAKVASIDGRVCAIGSANLDITAGYWENELMLIVDDASITSTLEARIDSFMARSQRLDRNDPKWQETARRRQWMRHWPGVLSI